jgi:hypothetical protein
MEKLVKMLVVAGIVSINLLIFGPKGMKALWEFDPTLTSCVILFLIFYLPMKVIEAIPIREPRAPRRRKVSPLWRDFAYWLWPHLRRTN